MGWFPGGSRVFQRIYVAEEVPSVSEWSARAVAGGVIFLAPEFGFVRFYTFECERKRNKPERYDSNVTEKTLKAIKGPFGFTISKIRSRREAKHIERIKKGKKGQLMREAVKEVEQSISLVKAPAVLSEDPSLVTLPKIMVKVSQPSASTYSPLIPLHYPLIIKKLIFIKKLSLM
ncbi:uncharacterized protein LOC133881959 [Alnus glutinosa]|uniref:uncharacterized protein LOC133881959 n=1 Tax=Alnus glutinosa TaxID=3517 RepID=UPI002D77B08D|nr:uncharacterized protein LOC133881959 [Alnus glutinosa]